MKKLINLDCVQGLLTGGELWSRRPTRWLKGLDGRKDLDYGLYVHEEFCREVMAEG